MTILQRLLSVKNYDIKSFFSTHQKQRKRSMEIREPPEYQKSKTQSKSDNMKKDNVENDFANQQCWTKYLTKVNKSCQIRQEQRTLISALSQGIMLPSSDKI